MTGWQTDSDFDRDLYDHNADYIARFAEIWPKVNLPKAQILVPGAAPSIFLNGVTVTVDLQFRLRRLTRTNKVQVGAAMLRYAKGKPLSQAVGAWQSAFLLGYLRDTGIEENAEPTHTLCLTLDAYSGTVHPAPGDAIRKYGQIKSACATISEWWPNINSPTGAVF